LEQKIPKFTDPVDIWGTREVFRIEAVSLDNEDVMFRKKHNFLIQLADEESGVDCVYQTSKTSRKV
jgi:hypothetical protein